MYEGCTILKYCDNEHFQSFVLYSHIYEVATLDLWMMFSHFTHRSNGKIGMAYLDSVLVTGNIKVPQIFNFHMYAMCAYEYQSPEPDMVIHIMQCAKSSKNVSSSNINFQCLSPSENQGSGHKIMPQAISF